jgi:hypothetical protein
MPKFILYDAAWGGFAEGLGIREPQELVGPWERKENEAVDAGDIVEGGSGVEDEGVLREDEGENTATSSPYEYREFEADGQIRLLEILPGTREDINCRLKHFALADTPPYEALSYCWGDATDLTPIQVNDHTLYITRSLRSALFHVRLEDEPRTVWADAICINQQDSSERASQVSLMDHIYQGCRQTLIWLGPGTEKTPNAFEQLSKLASQVENLSSTDGNGGAVDRKPYSADFGGHLNRNDNTIDSLLECDWWNRVWVVQEVLLAPAALVVCGRQTMPWDRFAFTFDTGLKGGLWDQILLGFLFDPTFTPFSSLYHLYVQHTAGGVSDLGAADQLVSLLVSLRVRNATDARDKIYAALGLMKDPENTVGILPDYESPPEDVYTRATSSILKASGNLDILGICSTNKLDESTLDLPSWVPDWSATGIVAEPFVVNQTSKFAATGDSKSSASFPDSVTLVLSGHLFDTIGEVGDLSFIDYGAAWDALDSDDEDDGESSETGKGKDASEGEDAGKEQDTSVTQDFASAGRLISGIYTNLADYTLQLAVYISWERLARADDESTAAALTGEPHAVAYMRTLCADQIPPADRAGAEADFRAWLGSLGALRALVRARVDGLPRVFRPLGFLAHLRATWDEVPAFVERMAPTRMRRLGRTAGPAGPGEGCLCLLPADARAGDQVWLVRGGRVPLVVRPHGEDGEAWELVGEAYVHGIMYGEAFHDGACVDMRIK